MTTVCDTSVPKRFDTKEAEQEGFADLALCDLSMLPKWGIKGRGAAAWLESADVSVPPGSFETAALADGGLVVRYPGDEFLLEGGVRDRVVSSLAKRAIATGDVFSYERQDGTILLTGARAREVLAQTCGLDFTKTPSDRVVMTRVAGVNCTILPQEIDGVLCYRIWADYSYAAYLWDTLVEISSDLGGRVIGISTVLSEQP